ncbi:MAG: chromosome segregation ATPase [Chitinophagaceae bacterium]|nr:chromosome segregation ATPase [Chitinophagaceae bacterium]
MKYSMKGIGVVLCFFCAVVFSYGKTIILEKGQDEYETLSNTIEIFEDPTTKVTLNDLLAHPNQFSFQEGGAKEQFSHHASSNYWIRFKIVNKAGLQSNWILEILDSRFSEVIFYAPDFGNPDHYIESKTGVQYDFSQREYQHKNFVFDIPFASLEDASDYYYLKIRPGTIGSFLFKIRQNKIFASYAFKEYLLLGMYYGIVFIMAFYNLFLFFTIREKVYIYYFFYAIAWAFDSSINDGLGFQFVWSQNHLITAWGSYSSKVIMLTFYLIYFQSFLDIRKNMPSSRTIMYALLFLFCSVSLVFPYVQYPFLYDLLFIIIFAYTLFIAAVVYKKGYKPARFFLLGNGVILLGLVLNTMKNATLFNFFLQGSPGMLITIVYIRNISMIMDIVILSFALGDRIRFLKYTNEKAQEQVINQLNENRILSDKVNRELEQKVAERTRIIEEKSAELKEANEQLKAQAEEINEMNAILDRDNWNLKKNVIQEKEARISLKQINFEEFSLVYPDEASCDLFMEEVKWEQGYVCKKCGNIKYGKGATAFARRCTKCRYDESITAYTAFHKCKFDIRKALYITVMINRYGENVSITDISRELDIRNATCWKFVQKLLVTVHKKEYEKLKDGDKLKYLILHS